MKVTIVTRTGSDTNPTTLEGKTFQDILSQCQYTLEEVIVLKDGRVIIEEEVSDGDTIELVPVASGG
jgi:sulfur carrier protein ThiS